MRDTENKIPWMFLAVIIIFLSAYMLYWGTQKQGYHIDEMFSMMIIRGGGLSRPYNYGEFINVWHTASELESTIGVTAGNAFTGIGASMSLYNNLLHIAYSFTPDTFSLWPSLILNIIIMAGCIVMIYLLSRLFIDNDYIALIPCLIWGVSSAAVNLVLFIRFYTLKTFICLLLTYVLFLALREKNMKAGFLIAIIAITAAGSFIHQYFLVYAFFLTIFACIFLISRKQVKSFLKFGAVMAAAALVYELISRGGISRLFTGTASGRAEEALAVIYSGNPEFPSHIQAYFSIISKAVFGNIGLFIIILSAVISVVILFIVNIKKRADIARILKNQKAALWLVMSGVCFAYLLTIAYIAPYQELRYIFCITPLIVILYTALSANALKVIGFKNTAAVFAVLSIPFIFAPAGNIRSFNLHWDEVSTDEVLADYYHLPVVNIGDRRQDMASCYWQLFEFEDKVLFATFDSIDYDILGAQTYDDGLVLMLWHSIDDSEAERIMYATGHENYTYVTDLVRHRVWYLGN